MLPNHSYLRTKFNLFYQSLLRDHRFSLCIAATVLLTALCKDTGRKYLMYGQAEIAAGEYWRLISGHLVHANFNHTMLNLAGLLLIAWLFERNAHAYVWGGLAALMALLSSIGYLLFTPEMHYYVGFSGVLHGLFYVAAISEWPVDRRMSGGLLLMLTAKLIHAQLFGASDGTEALIGAPIAEQAHIIGSILGVALALGLRRQLFRTWKNSKIEKQNSI